MKEAGCFSISFGIETYSLRLLKILKKGTTPEINERAVKLAKRAGLRVRGTFILGIPGETIEDSHRTINYASQLGLDEAKFSLATPYPGTELFQLAYKEGLLKEPIDFSRLSAVSGFGSYEPVYVPRGRRGKELQRLQLLAHIKFYFNPLRIIRILGDIRGGFKELM
jgi:radical SAM superfamily enzyme YgiQ (UPF0313 family)